MKRTAWSLFGVGLVAAMALVPSAATATVELQRQARKLGFPVENCHYCHASEAAVKKMKDQARQLGYENEHNCVYCHGKKIPATLNDRGMWLLARKNQLHADSLDMAWLKDYVPPTPTPTPPAKQ